MRHRSNALRHTPRVPQKSSTRLFIGEDFGTTDPLSAPAGNTPAG